MKNNQTGPKLQHDYPCSGCDMIFNNSIDRAKHEYYMRSKGKGHEKRRDP